MGGVVVIGLLWHTSPILLICWRIISCRASPSRDIQMQAISLGIGMAVQLYTLSKHTYLYCLQGTPSRNAWCRRGMGCVFNPPNVLIVGIHLPSGSLHLCAVVAQLSQLAVCE